jgi:uncharacterized membrane protein YadS
MFGLGQRGWLWVFVILLLLGACSAAQSAIAQLVLMRREQLYWPAIGYNFLLSTLLIVLIPLIWTTADRTARSATGGFAGSPSKSRSH